MIGFLFLIKQELHAVSFWEEFFHQAPPDQYEIYVHAKHPNQIKTDWLQQNLVSHLVPTRWGDISLVKATYCLFHEAYQNKKIQQVVLVSDSCLPTVPFSVFYREITRSNKSWIHYKHLSNKLDRYQSLHPFIREKVPFTRFYSQYQWLMLQRRHLKIALEYHHWIPYFNRVPAVDEHFLISIFAYLGILRREFENRKLTYCDWNSHPTEMHPREFKILDRRFVRRVFQEQGCLLLRKVAKGFQVL